MCDFLLIGWWRGNREALQESCAQPEVTILNLGGGFSSAEELNSIVVYIPWGGTRTLPQACTIVSWLLLPPFCIRCLPGLATVWIYFLKLREGHGSWVKPIFYKQETKDTKRICTRDPHGVLLSFTLFLILVTHESHKSGSCYYSPILLGGNFLGSFPGVIWNWPCMWGAGRDQRKR